MNKAEAARLNGAKGGRPRKSGGSAKSRASAGNPETHETQSIHPLLEPCTARERLFVLALVADPTNKTRAYEKAFKAKGASASANATKCLRKDRVRAAYEALSGTALAVAVDDAVADAAERRVIATTLARGSKVPPVARLKAIDVMNKMDGLYITKHQVGGEDGGPIRVIFEDAPEPPPHA